MIETFFFQTEGEFYIKKLVLSSDSKNCYNKRSIPASFGSTDCLCFMRQHFLMPFHVVNTVLPSHQSLAAVWQGAVSYKVTLKWK